jgi:hypothetical protein
MPKLVEKDTGKVVQEGSYDKTKDAEQERIGMYSRAKNDPDLEIVHGKKTYQTGGLVNRKPETARLPKRGDKISRARGCKIV